MRENILSKNPCIFWNKPVRTVVLSRVSSFLSSEVTFTVAKRIAPWQAEGRRPAFSATGGANESNITGYKSPRRGGKEKMAVRTRHLKDLGTPGGSGSTFCGARTMQAMCHRRARSPARSRDTHRSPCLRRRHPPRVYRRTCRWQLGSSRCSPVLGWSAAGGGGRGCSRSGSPRPQRSAGFQGSWISSDPRTVLHLYWGSLGGSEQYRISEREATSSDPRI